MDKITQQLNQLGFTKNTAKVLLFLFKAGRVRAGQVIKEMKLPRSVVYLSLSELTSRGAISETEEKGVKVYWANSPESLVLENKRLVTVAEEVAHKIAAETNFKEKEIRTREGYDVIEDCANELLENQSGTTIYFLGPSKFGTQKDLEPFWKNFHQKRVRKALQCKILYDTSVEQTTLDKRNNLHLCQARYLPFGAQLPMWYMFAGDKMTMVVPGTTPPVAITIRSEETVFAIREYFEYLWKQSNKV